MIDSIFDRYQNRKINEAKQEAESARNKATSVEAKIIELERHCNSMALASQAMWELLKEHSNLKDSDIESKILEIDLRDGQIDERISQTVVKCPSCNRNSNSKRDSCIYCGAITAKQNIFE
tara:strand:- start:23 stop:385 length:363 start_codon:yes stop_codon:yes gene_type:complete